MTVKTAEAALHEAQSWKTAIKAKRGAIITVAVVLALAAIAGTVIAFVYANKYENMAAAFAKDHGVNNPFIKANWTSLSERAIWLTLQERCGYSFSAGLLGAIMVAPTFLMIAGIAIAWGIHDHGGLKHLVKKELMSKDAEAGL